MKNGKRGTKFFSFICTTFTLLVLFIVFDLISLTLTRRQQVSPVYIQRSNQNWIIVYYDIELPQLYTDKNSTTKLKRIHQEITAHSHYEIHDQPIEVADFSGESSSLYSFSVDGGESSVYETAYDSMSRDVSLVNSIQISLNTQGRFNLLANSGRLFVSDDYIYQADEPLPVLLGASYKNSYAVGDLIESWYIFYPIPLEVVGFLKEGACLEYAGLTVPLDHYMVMPSFDCQNTPHTYEEHVFQIRHYANKLVGYFEYFSQGDADEIFSAFASLEKEIDGSFEVDLITNPIEYDILAALQSNPAAYLDKYDIILLVIAAGFAVLIPLCYILILTICAQLYDHPSKYGSTVWKKFGLFALQLAISILVVLLLGVLSVVPFSIGIPVIAVAASLLTFPIFLFQQIVI